MEAAVVIDLPEAGRQIVGVVDQEPAGSVRQQAQAHRGIAAQIVLIQFQRVQELSFGLVRIAVQCS